MEGREEAVAADAAADPGLIGLRAVPARAAVVLHTAERPLRAVREIRPDLAGIELQAAHATHRAGESSGRAGAEVHPSVIADQEARRVARRLERQRMLIG